MAAIMNSTMLNWDTAILDSDTLLSSLWFTQKHSHSTLTLNQTNSFWLKLIPSHVTWWWQASWILPSWIWPFCTKLWLKLIQSDSKSFILSQLDDGSHLEFCLLAFNHFAPKKLHSFILTQLDDGSHLEFCQLEFHHLGFNHLSIYSQTHSDLPRLVPTICRKKTDSFILTQLDDHSHLEFCHVEFRHMASWVQTPCYLLSDSLKNTLTPIWLWIKLIQSDSNSFILT